MNSEDKFWISFWAMVFIFILSIIIIGCTYTYKETAKYIDNGYELVFNTTSGSKEWRKHNQ